MAEAEAGRVALFSIHPRFAEAILCGQKQVEFRRRSPAAITHVVVYATAPVQRVVGWFRVAGIDEDSPQGLWERFGETGGVDAAEFERYYASCTLGSAIKVGETARLVRPLELSEVGIDTSPPQSFQYLPWHAFKEMQQVLTSPHDARMPNGVRLGVPD